MIAMFRTLGTLAAFVLAAAPAYADDPPAANADVASAAHSDHRPGSADAWDNAAKQIARGRNAFRFDTFGDEAFWGGALGLHEKIAGAANGGVGDGLSPEAALGLGLKVDVRALPPPLVARLRAGRVNLDDPAVTLALLKLNAVVGVRGFFDRGGKKLESVGITCALCHSTVDDSFTDGIGARLDGWANRDLNVGEIIAFSKSVAPFAQLLGVDEEAVRKVLRTWGPGKFDAQLLLDGQTEGPEGSAATLIPPAFGLAGVNLHTWTGWGSVTYWNAFVAVLEMQGKGTFYDPRLDDASKFPIAAKNGFGNVRLPPGETDRVTPKLDALHVYQLAIPAPKPPEGSFNARAAERGAALFAADGKARCATCHVPPLYTEPGYNLHTPEEVGIDGFQAMRSPAEGYRTAPLRGLWTHTTGGLYHDGRFETLLDVVDHYNSFQNLGLTGPEKNDLVEFLKSL